VLEFSRKCVQHLGDVTLTVVSYPGVHIEAAQALAEAIGAKFRVREYNNVG
jgi:TatD DNase family protein